MILKIIDESNREAKLVEWSVNSCIENIKTTMLNTFDATCGWSKGGTIKHEGTWW